MAAPTFLDAQTRLLSAVNRPSTETAVLAEVKASINDAVSILQRNHAYKYTEKLSSVVYPASTLFVDLGTICGGLLRDVISIQEVSSDGQIQGKPLKIVSYAQLQSMRMKYDRTHGLVPPYSSNDVLTGWTIEDGYRCDRIAFLAGQNLGLYPRPGAVVNLLIHCHIWLPSLVADADTNFFLLYAYDIVHILALKNMHIFMKDDARFTVTEQQVADSLVGLVAWDSQVGENYQTSLS